MLNKEAERKKRWRLWHLEEEDDAGQGDGFLDSKEEEGGKGLVSLELAVGD